MAKTQAMHDLKEDAYKPVFKAIRDAFGVSMATGVMLVTLSISVIFEISHLLLILFRAQQHQRLAYLKQSLIQYEANYMQQTGKAFDGGDFAEFAQGAIPKPDAPEPRKDSYKEPKPGFGFVPQRALHGNPATFAGREGFADSSVIPPLFKYQQHPQPSAPEAGKQPFGFVPPRPKTDVPTSAPGSTYREELRNGSKLFADQALDSPVHPPALTSARTVTPTVPARSETVPDTVPARSQNAIAETVQDGLTNEAKQAETDLYPDWLALVQGRGMSPGARDCKRFISQRTKTKDDKTGLTVQEMGRIWVIWQNRALADGVLKPNPDYSNGKAKYILS